MLASFPHPDDLPHDTLAPPPGRPPHDTLVLRSNASATAQAFAHKASVPDEKTSV